MFQLVTQLTISELIDSPRLKGGANLVLIWYASTSDQTGSKSKNTATYVLFPHDPEI